MTGYGPLGRLGAWTAGHFKLVLLTWVAIAVGLGAFAPKVEQALSGAGWEANGSESVAAREAVDASFAGQGSYVCFDELDRYVELEVAGHDADAVIPGLRAHLAGCPACREEHDSLYALVSGEQVL